MKRAASTALATKKATSTRTSSRASKKKATSNSNDAAASSSSSSSSFSPYFKKLPREFYDKDCLELSQELLGKVLVRRLPHGEILRGTIVETEAYGGEGENDRASKSFKGKITESNKPMFMDPGTSYVYFTYGMYHCFNISSKGAGSACLIRALEPLEDSETMHNFRQKSKKKTVEPESVAIPAKKGRGKAKQVAELPQPPALTKKRFKIYELANGPGKLCMAFDIRRDNCNKLDMSISDVMWLENSEDPRYNVKGSFEIETAKRVGIDSTPPEARDKPWRFFVKNNFAVSTAKPSQIKKLLAAENG